MNQCMSGLICEKLNQPIYLINSNKINPISNVLIKNAEDTQRVLEVESVINCNTKYLVQLSCGSVNAQLCLSDDCNFNFSVEQTRGQKYKLFSSLRLFSE